MLISAMTTASLEVSHSICSILEFRFIQFVLISTHR